MAINTTTGDSNDCSSPRLSFSDDLQETNSVQNQEVEVIRLDGSILLNRNSEFNFCVTNLPVKDPYYPADELFFNGMIIPTQMKEKLNSINGYSKEAEENEEDDEEITGSTTATLIREEKTHSKSIWRFRRSSSLNCENYGHKKSSIWSLPLLFRSKSTGLPSVNSHLHSKQSLGSKSTGLSLVNSSDDNSMHNQKNSKILSNLGSKPSCSSHQKPPLRKGGPNGTRSPILNVPSPYITKGTSDLLGLSTLFRSGSIDKNSKKLLF